MNINDTKPIRLLLITLLIALLSACGPSSTNTSTEKTVKTVKTVEPAGPVDKTIEIRANDQMKFNIGSFEVAAGQTIKIVLKNIGSMPKMSMGHNVVVLQPGTDEKAFVEAAMLAAATDYIPADHKSSVVAHTKMLGGGEEDSVVFTVPDQKGEYPYICSFPGHFQVGMKGVMSVR